ncbi:TetR/AcrR family transcriptional regulator [Aeromicrobium sp. UC242_57]|uniref:TetR/AcrR family transcriptional regulator n=1 Tax=Aeromicrobium sp. UC242_57 TaxID=3374624 RepID=UPI0037970332
MREAPRSGPSRLEAVLAGLSARSARTVHLIVRAGADSFAEQGYHDANVDAIVKRAGFARGTYYKYFAESSTCCWSWPTSSRTARTVLIGVLGQLGPALRSVTTCAPGFATSWCSAARTWGSCER